MYLDREKLLSVSQPPVDLEEVEKKVRVEIEERNRQLQTLVNGLTAKNLGLEAEIKELKAKTEKMGLDFKKEITEKEGQIEKMEHAITDVVRDIDQLKKLVAKSLSQ